MFFEQVFLEHVSDLFPSACKQYLNEYCIDDTSKDTLIPATQNCF